MISLLCASARPKRLKQMIESALNMAQGVVEVVVRHDNDPEIVEICQKLDNVREIGGVNVQNKHSMYNECAKLAQGDIFGCLGDDVVFESAGWDMKIQKAIDRMPCRLGVAWGNDGYWQYQLGIHPFFSREWYNALGYALPEMFKVNRADDWLTALAMGIGQAVYLPSVKMTHYHPEFNKKPELSDEIYKRSDAHRKGDILEYDRLSETLLPMEIKRLKGMISE